MDIRKLKSLLLWCTLLNVVILFLAAFGSMLMPDFVYDLHSQWFGISKDAVNIAIYGFIGLYKLLWIFFNLIPLIALSFVKAD